VAKKSSETSPPVREVEIRHSPVGTDYDLAAADRTGVVCAARSGYRWARTGDYAQAWWDWYLQVAAKPDKGLALAQSAIEKTLQSWQFRRARSWMPARSIINMMTALS